MNFYTLLAFGLSAIMLGFTLVLGYIAAQFIGLPLAIGLGVGCLVALVAWFWYETKIAVGE